MQSHNLNSSYCECRGNVMHLHSVLLRLFFSVDSFTCVEIQTPVVLVNTKDNCILYFRTSLFGQDPAENVSMSWSECFVRIQNIRYTDTKSVKIWIWNHNKRPSRSLAVNVQTTRILVIYLNNSHNGFDTPIYLKTDLVTISTLAYQLVMNIKIAFLNHRNFVFSR